MHSSATAGAARNMLCSGVLWPPAHLASQASTARSREPERGTVRGVGGGVWGVESARGGKMAGGAALACGTAEAIGAIGAATACGVEITGGLETV